MVSTELLRRYPLFAGQSNYMLDEIAMLSNETTRAEGEWLFHENEEATKLYLVLEGAVALTMFVYLNGEQQHLASSHSLGKNEIVGWSSIIPPHQYKLGARASKDCKLLVIDAVPLRQLLDDNPEYGYHFLRQIAEVVSERFMLVNIQIMSLMVDNESKSASR
jgi:CRP/FNR family transcriptional regulator, cyclic AMP receptor protein